MTLARVALGPERFVLPDVMLVLAAAPFARDELALRAPDGFLRAVVLRRFDSFAALIGFQLALGIWLDVVMIVARQGLAARTRAGRIGEMAVRFDSKLTMSAFFAPVRHGTKPRFSFRFLERRFVDLPAPDPDDSPLRRGDPCGPFGGDDFCGELSCDFGMLCNSSIARSSRIRACLKLPVCISRACRRGME